VKRRGLGLVTGVTEWGACLETVSKQFPVGSCAVLDGLLFSTVTAGLDAADKCNNACALRPHANWAFSFFVMCPVR
jgi:hypothetical protein